MVQCLDQVLFPWGLYISSLSQYFAFGIMLLLFNRESHFISSVVGILPPDARLVSS